MFPTLFEGEDIVVEGEGAIAENNRLLKEQFNNRWGWHELGREVAIYINTDLLKVMTIEVTTVLMYATLIKEKTDTIKK